MVDETTDQSNTEQMVFCLRQVMLMIVLKFMRNLLGCIALSQHQLNHRALYTHCYGHALNLAAQDSLSCMQDTLDTTYEIIKLIKIP